MKTTTCFHGEIRKYQQFSILKKNGFIWRYVMALDKSLESEKKTVFLFLCKCMLWVCIRRALARHF